MKYGAEIKYKKETLSQDNPKLHKWLGTIEESVPKVIIRNSHEKVNLKNQEKVVDPKIKTQERNADHHYPEKSNRITIGMTDTERSEILKKKSLVVPIYEGKADTIVSVNKKDLENQQIGLIKDVLVRIGEEFNVFTDYDIKDVEVKIFLSRNNLKESVSKDVSPVQLAKLLPMLKDAVENAIGVESHSNRYFYDNSTVFFENLLGGYIDDNWFVPIRFGLKHSNIGKATLYVIVDQQKIEKKKIKAEIVNASRPQKTEEHASPSTYIIIISQIIPFVNNKDLLRYIPDDMLTLKQKQIKWEGIDETIFKYIVRVGKAKNGMIFYDINLEVDGKVPRANRTSLIKMSTSKVKSAETLPMHNRLGHTPEVGVGQTSTNSIRNSHEKVNLKNQEKEKKQRLHTVR